MSDHLAYAARTHMMEENYFKIGENPVIFLYTLRDYVNFVECIKLALERILLESGACLCVLFVLQLLCSADSTAMGARRGAVYRG
jgi:hypothetical protein